MIVNVVPHADLPYVAIEGIRSDRALRVFLGAVTPWYAFGRYEDVIVDLSSFDDWSPSVVDQLAAAVTAAGDAGRWLAFFPADEHRMRRADLGHIHGYPDRAQAQLAMQGNRLARQRRSRRSARRALVKKTLRHAVSRPLDDRRRIEGRRAS